MAFSSLVRLTLSIALISSFVLDVICFTPLPWFAQTSAFIGNKIYYMGGVVPLPEPIISDFFYLDTPELKSTDSTLPWTELTGVDNLFTSWGTAVAGGANKDLFILFGGNMTPAENSSLVIVYNTNNNTWSKPVISSPQGEPARKRKTQAVIDSAGKMYIFGGSTTPEPDISLVNDMFILDTVNWSWSTGTQDGAPDARSDFSATILSNGFIVYIGGININNRYVPMSQINTYDTNSATWANMEATGDIPNPRGGHSAVLASDGRIIVYGGSLSISADGQYTAASPDLAILDTTNNNFVWSQPKAVGTAPPQIAYHTASLIGDSMVVSFGNTTNKGSSPDVYVLDTKDKNYKWVTSVSINTSETNSSSNVGIIVGATIGGIIGLILLGGGLFWFYRNRKVTEEVIETPGEFTDAGFTRRYESMNSATTSQTSHDFSKQSLSANTESDPSREFHPSYSHNFPVRHEPEIDDDDKEFRILPEELQPEYLEKKFNNDDNI